LVFAESGRKDPNWAFSSVVKFLISKRSCKQKGDNLCYGQKLYKEY
jgi:hypothetical protein